MHPTRVQLHSSAGRLLLIALSFWFVLALAGGAVAIALSLRAGRLSPALVTLPVQLFVLFIVARWARRNAQRVYASEQGVELSRPPRLVPWSNIDSLRDLGWLGGALIHLHELRFRDGSPRLVFYAQPHAVFLFREVQQRAALPVSLHENH